MPHPRPLRETIAARERPSSRVHRIAPVHGDTGVEELQDHDLLYSHPDSLPWLAFWRDAAEQPWPASDEHPADTAAERREALMASLTSAGHRLLACDLTPPELRALDVHVVRAVIPGFQPIDFGAREARLGGRRLYDLPARLGLRAGPLERRELNPLPHPIS